MRFNPQLVVIGSGQNMTLNNIFQLTYSISSGDALTTDEPLGNVTIDEPTLNTLVVILDYHHAFSNTDLSLQL